MCKCTLNKNQETPHKNCACGCHDTCHDTGAQKPCPKNYDDQPEQHEETSRNDYSKRR